MFMKFRSVAFRQGFANGFMAPFSLFGGVRKVDVSQENIVAESWHDVGEAIRQSMPSGEKNGKTTATSKATHHKERSAA